MLSIKSYNGRWGQEPGTGERFGQVELKSFINGVPQEVQVLHLQQAKERAEYWNRSKQAKAKLKGMQVETVPSVVLMEGSFKLS